jgi:hypothetical protein
VLGGDECCEMVRFSVKVDARECEEHLRSASTHDEDASCKWPIMWEAGC